jgi:MvaI/BcnI restriction endonuclease family
MSFATVQVLASCMAQHGATRLYAKELAPNDNTKNQIYLGPSFEVLQLIPFGEIIASTIAPEKVLQASVNLDWIDETGESAPASRTKFILYPQYPEVRLSGFVMGCRHAPSEWLNNEKKGRAEGRVLFLGVSPNGKVLAYLGTPASPLAGSYQAIKTAFPNAGVLMDISGLLQRQKAKDQDGELISRLRAIHQKGWIEAKRLVKGGKIVECNGTNCGGLTLEAELGVEENGAAEPDFLGWEIKQHKTTNYLRHGTGPITLLTPEPDGGSYVDGVEEFVEKYGEHTERENISYFQGIHYAGTEHPDTKMRIEVIGFDKDSGKITDANGCVVLLSQKEEVAASWSFRKILTHWCRKHNKAAYIPAEVDRESERPKYRFGKDIKLCRSTDPTLLLKGITSGSVYYDPGIKLDRATGKTHRRSQFRVKFNQVGMLYRHSEEVDTTKGT